MSLTRTISFLQYSSINNYFIESTMNNSIFIQYLKKQALKFRSNIYASFGTCAKLYKKDVKSLYSGKSSLKYPTKTVEEPKIMFRNEDKQYVETTLEDAKKIAKSKNMMLVMENKGSENSKARYKIARLSEVFNTEIPNTNNHNTEHKKKNKQIYISNDITDHDFKIKINKIQKMLTKGYSVKLGISTSSGNKDVAAMLEKSKNALKGLCSMSKTTKTSNFVILSPMKDVPIVNDEPDNICEQSEK